MSILDQFSLKNKVALVTGGAGMYGRQIVRALAEAGAQTFVAARTLETVEAVAAEHRAAGYDVTALQYDQGDENSILQLRDTLLERAGRLDVLVNNAVSRSMKKAYRDAAVAFAESMHINATGLFIITRAFGDAMAERQSGSIINIGSIHGMIGPDESIYCDPGVTGWYPDYFFHKGGMLNFTRFTASYYGSKGVRCNCIAAGGFKSTQSEQFVHNYSQRTFLGRMANETDLAGLVVLLASDASAYITGTNIPVDGGYTAK